MGSGEAQTPQRIVVFIDAQNVMMDARRAFFKHPFSGTNGQIDPLLYGQHLAARQPFGTEGQTRKLEQVRIYRGRPHSQKEPKTNAAFQRQVAKWESNGVVLTTRDLRYPYDWPKTKAEEKGIDVALAIDAIAMAIRGELDVAVLATTDTDQRPVLEAYHELPIEPRPTIETATWKSDCFHKKLQVKGYHVWSHFLDFEDYKQVRDLRDYNIAK